jgi:hypothetical protein
MSLEKLIKTLAASIDIGQEMRDMEDRPIQRQKCMCCVIRTTNADGSVASEFWYQATNNGSGYSCAWSISGSPKKKYCDECGYLAGQRERGPSVVDDAPPITRPSLG